MTEQTHPPVPAAATLEPAPEADTRTIELCVVEETDVALFTTYEFTLPRTPRGCAAFSAVKKIRETPYKVGNIDRIIKLVKPFPYKIRVADTPDRITISVSSEAFEEEIEHEAPPFDEALDTPIKDSHVVSKNNERDDDNPEIRTVKLSLWDEQEKDQDNMVRKYEIEIPRTTRGVTAWHELEKIKNVETRYQYILGCRRIIEITKPFKIRRIEKQETNNRLKFRYEHTPKIDGEFAHDCAEHDKLLDAPVSSWNKQ